MKEKKEGRGFGSLSSSFLYFYFGVLNTSGGVLSKFGRGSNSGEFLGNFLYF